LSPIAAPNARHHRHAGESVELAPQIRQRLLEIDCHQLRSNSRIDIRDNPAVNLPVDRISHLGPVLFTEGREVRTMTRLQHPGGVVPVSWWYRGIEVVADLHQTLGLDHRADVVENDRSE
jgi:hypothetical protein